MPHAPHRHLTGHPAGGQRDRAVALLITDILSDGLDIEGVGTWILATLIVWVCTMVATLILQKVFRPERGPARA